MAGQSQTVESLDRLQQQTGGEISDGTVGTFCVEKVYSEQLSIDAEEPVYIEHTFCDIRVPGNVKGNHRELIRKKFPDGRDIVVNEFHIKKYGRAWDAFLRGEDLRPEGTPLEECPDIPRERLAGLKTADIRTVEELAQLPDRSLQRIGPDGRALQKAAAGYIAEHDAGSRAIEEVGELKEQVAKMQAQLDAQGAGSDGNDQDAPAKRSGTSRRNKAG